MKKAVILLGHFVALLLILLGSISLAAPPVNHDHAANTNRYNGYRLMRVYPMTFSALRYLQELADRNMELDFWLRPSQLFFPVDVMVPPDTYSQVVTDMRSQGLVPVTSIPDVGRAFVEMAASSVYWPSLGTHQRAFTYDNFYNSAELLARLASLQATYPTTTSLSTIGTTAGGRNIQMMTVKFNGINTGSSKPVIFIEAGIHAREWISPAGVLYALEEMLKTRGTPFTNFDFYIVVMANPDGYDYTFTTDRLWRKNRRNTGSSCIGVDLNRNFGYGWGGNGSSTDPCSGIFAGPSAFSELETQAIRDAVTPLTSRLKLYASIHSYSQYVLYPWGNQVKFAKDFLKMKKVAKSWAKGAETVQNSYYRTGQSSWILYIASGCSDDWAKSIGASTALTVELPPASTSVPSGQSGFIVSPSQIPIIGKEIYEGLRGAANNIK